MMKPLNTWKEFLEDRREKGKSFLMADAELICNECANRETDWLLTRDTFEDGDDHEWLVIGSTSSMPGTCIQCLKTIVIEED